MEQCPVCGNTYGISHSCPGPPTTEFAVAAKWPKPKGFAPIHYFRQALAIARLDDDAVVAASRDKHALLYGGTIWIVGRLLAYFAGILWAGGGGLAKLYWIVLLLNLGFSLALELFLMLAQYGTCHLLARWWFGARGTYVGVLRPWLLGSIVMWLPVFSFTGMIIARLLGAGLVWTAVIASIVMVIAGLWSVAVMMIVFDDVDGIGRLKALGLSCVLGFFFQVMVRALFTVQ